MDADKLLKDVLARGDRLKGDRSTVESTWQEIRDLVFPSGASITSKETPGQKNNPLVLDNTGENANELLASALFAGATHPEQPWFGVRAQGLEPGQDRAADVWLETLARRTLARFNSPRSNFAPAQDEKLIDLSTYGSGCTFVGEIPGGPPLFQARSMAECLFAQNQFGRVDTVYRIYEQTASAAVEEFGGAAGDHTAKKAADPKTADDTVEFCHAVYPRRARDPGRADAENMPFASVWINRSEKTLVKVSGFPEFPYACPRWRKRAGEAYGRGPGHKALADIKMLQRAMKSQIRGVEKANDPAYMVADDGVLNTLRLGSGKANYIRADMLMSGRGDPIRPIQNGVRTDLGDKFMEQVRQRVEHAYFTHLIQFARDPKMTATQFLGITEQTLQVLSPILTRLQIEDAQPMLERVVSIGFRNGWYPEPPDSIRGRELRFEYVSPSTRRQYVAEAHAAAQTFDMLIPLATTNPEVFDNFDVDAMARDVGSIMGMRATWIRGIDQVKAIRQARAEAQQQQTQVDQAEQIAGAAASGAKALQVFQGGRKEAA